MDQTDRPDGGAPVTGASTPGDRATGTRAAGGPWRRWTTVVVVVVVVVVVAVAAVAVVTRAARWWPVTERRSVAAAQTGGAWPFPSQSAELACRRHWGGRQAASVVVEGREYGLDGHATDDGLPSAGAVFVQPRDRAVVTPYLLALNELTLSAQELCQR